MQLTIKGKKSIKFDKRSRTDFRFPFALKTALREMVHIIWWNYFLVTSYQLY